MRIDIKYDKGDKVWLIHDNKLVQAEVDAFHATKDSSGTLRIRYNLKFPDERTDRVMVPLLHGGYLEADLFPSKEELIKSL